VRRRYRRLSFMMRERLLQLRQFLPAMGEHDER
jgi:hypothetical protein